MTYGGNPKCSHCCTDEHERCLGVWATQDQRFWFECGCEKCEARECAAYDEEKPKSQARQNFEDSVNALFGGPGIRALDEKLEQEHRKVLDRPGRADIRKDLYGGPF